MWALRSINLPHPNDTQPSQGSNSEIPSNGNTQGNSDNDLLFTPEYPDIVWAEKISSDNGLVDRNGKRIEVGLYEALSHYSDDTVFAIVTQASGGKNQEYRQFVYNGKTLVEYEKEVEEERKLSEKLPLLFKSGDDLKYGEALYKIGNDKGQKWSKEHYDSIVAYFGEGLLSKYIVEGEFLREKLEYDYSQPVTVTAEIAWYKAYDAYENHIIQQTKEQLTEQGVIFESKNAVYNTNVIKYPLADNLVSEEAYISIERSKPYIIIYLSKEKFSSLTGNYEHVIFRLADRNTRDGTFPSDPADAMIVFD